MNFDKELGGVAVAKDRISMYLCYKDIFGHNVESRIQAASQQIIVSYEIYAESTTEDFITDKEFGSGPKDKFDIFKTPGSEDSVASAVIARENYSPENITSVIENLWDTSIKNIEIKIVNANDAIQFKTDFMETILKTFSKISVDMGSANCYLYLPSVSMHVNSLTIKNANIRTDVANYEFDENFTIENCAISTSSESQPMVKFECKREISASNIYITNPIVLSLVATTSQPSFDWKKTSITLSTVRIVFEDKVRAENKRYKPVIVLSGAYTSHVSDIGSVKDIPDYPLIQFNNGYEYFVSDIERIASIPVRAKYTVGLNGVAKFMFNGGVYNTVDNQFMENIKFFEFDGVPVNSDYSIMNCDLRGINFSNLVGSIISNLTVSDSKFIGCSEFAKCGMSGINKLTLSNVIGEFDNEFAVAASEVNIFKSEIKVKDGNVKITCNEGSSTIQESSFTVDEAGTNETNIIQLEKRYGGTISVYGTTFDGRLNAIGGDRFDSIKDSDIVPSSVSKMSARFENSHFYRATSFGKLDSVDLNYCVFAMADTIDDSIAFEDIPSLKFQTTIRYRGAKTNFKAKNVYFGDSILSLSEMPNKASWEFDTCEGTVTLYFKDDCNKTAVGHVLLEDSALHVKTYSESKRTVAVYSKGNRGSIIEGGEENNVSFSPTMDSPDRQKFKSYNADTSPSPDEDFVYYTV